MISFSRLGGMGRIGNSLFQISCVVGFARKHGMDYVLPKWKHADAFKNKINQSDSVPPFPIYKEPNFHYNEIPNYKDVDLVGYFQGEKYFKHCENEIRELFEPSDAIKKRIKKEYGKILEGNTCAIHIRRGDYLQLGKYHTNISMWYYKNAVDKIKADHYLVFSDDIEWCKEKIHGAKVTHINTGDDIYDFFIMAECKNFIIANSSFSWWASYLSKHPQKRIIAPRKNDWFGVDAKNRNVDDLYLSNWEFSIKSAVIIFHKNINRYPKQWIDKCITSIRGQTYKDFDVFEVDYGGGNIQAYAGSNFESRVLSDHAQAHNYLLDKVFSLGYDCAFNVNVDDFYALNRFEKQIKCIEQGQDVVSSNFYNVDESDRVIAEKRMDILGVNKEANANHNIIAHPVCCYSKNFWTTCTKLHSEEIPRDDFELWKRSYAACKYKFLILPDYLLYYRVSSKKVSAPQNH